MSGMKITTIPHFLSARSPKGLRRLMLRNNVKHGLIFDYKIMVYGENLLAWFILDAVDALEEEIKEMEARGKS